MTGKVVMVMKGKCSRHLAGHVQGRSALAAYAPAAYAPAVCILAVCVLAAGILTGCSSGKKGADSLAGIQKEQVMKVAVLQDNSPYSQADEAAQEASGREVELARILGEDLGARVQFIPVDKKGLVSSVEDQTAHIAIGRIACTDGIKTRAAVSIAYDTGRLYVVTARGDFSSTPGAFSSMAVGASSGLSELSGIVIHGIQDVSVQEYGETDTVEADIMGRKIRGYFCYETEAQSLMRNPQLQAQSVTGIEAEQYVVVMNQSDTALKEQIDGILSQMIESGEMDRLMNP